MTLLDKSNPLSGGIRNLTPHPIKIHIPGRMLEIQPEGTIPRVGMNSYTEVGSVEVSGIKVPIRKTTMGFVENLPDPQKGIWLVVSSIVRTHPSLSHRTDLISPDTSPAGVVRDEAGNITGVTGFQI